MPRGLGQPALAVRVEPRLLDVADEPAPFGVGDAAAGARLGEAQRLAREYKQRTAHRQMLDQGAVDVEGTLQIAHRHALDARPGGQVDRRGIGPVQADHAPGRLHDVARPIAWCQAVATGQPGSALCALDLSHPRILPRPHLATTHPGPIHPMRCPGVRLGCRWIGEWNALRGGPCHCNGVGNPYGLDGDGDGIGSGPPPPPPPPPPPVGLLSQLMMGPLPGPCRQKSSPGPPMRRSRPKPPISRSAPDPPRSRSLPRSPRSRSMPLPPATLSLPEPAQTISEPPPARIESLPSSPTITSFWGRARERVRCLRPDDRGWPAGAGRGPAAEVRGHQPVDIEGGIEGT